MCVHLAGGHPQLLLGLLANKACLQRRDSFFRTALHYAGAPLLFGCCSVADESQCVAAAAGQVGCMEALIAKGIDVSAPDRDGNRAMDLIPH